MTTKRSTVIIGKKSIYTLFTIVFLLAFSFSANALDRRGRLGIGASNQLVNDIPAISLKLQRSKSFSMGAIFGIDTANDGGYGAGIKLYRNLFEEPQLNFYTAGLFAVINQKIPRDQNQTGFQVDWTFGSEFSFSGLQSLGFSIEFGVSLNKIDDFKAQTLGDHMIKAGVHFYL